MVIEKKNCQISKNLYDEIKYAQENLKISEEKKKQGVKKKKWSFIEASEKLGEFLHSQRKYKR